MGHQNHKVIKLRLIIVDVADMNRYEHRWTELTTGCFDFDKKFVWLGFVIELGATSNADNAVLILISFDLKKFRVGTAKDLEVNVSVGAGVSVLKWDLVGEVHSSGWKYMVFYSSELPLKQKL